jgi:hypothetical protein
MIIKKVSKFSIILTEFSMLLILNYLSAFGQQSGFYIIPTENRGVETASVPDSMQKKIDYVRLGKWMWYGDNGTEWPANMPNKVRAKSYACFVNGWVKYESQFDTLTKTMDYTINTPCYNSSGNDFWTQNITVNVVGSNTIIINSPVDVTAKIYEAYEVKSAIPQFSVVGNGINQSFPVNFESNKSYIVVFINKDNAIVNIKRIEA